MSLRKGTRWLDLLLQQRSARSTPGNLRSQKKKNRRAFRLELLEERKLMVGDVTGSIFNDLNSNGISDPNEDGIAGWTVFADSNGNGVYNSGEPSTVTDAKGKFGLFGLPAGSVNIYEVPQDPFAPTSGFSDHQLVTIRNNKEERVKFPNVTAPVTHGAVHGTVFEDFNENGIKESGEKGLAGWTLFVDSNSDGLWTAGEPTAITDTDGDYVISEILAGKVTVVEIPQSGYQPTVGGLFPLDGAVPYRTVSVIAGDSARADFANSIPAVGDLKGTVWNDDNGNGLRDSGETAMSGVTVYVDANRNGFQDAGEPSRVSNLSGEFSIASIHTGAHKVTAAVGTEFIAAEGFSMSPVVSVFRGGTTNVSFMNLIPRLGSIGGELWNDDNGNGIRETSELALSGWTVYVDANANGALDPTERQSLTDAAGRYSMNNMPYGTHAVRVDTPANWIGTNPVAGSQTFRLLNGEAKSTIHFGIREKVGNVVGTVWNDDDGSGTIGAGDVGASDRTVFLDQDADGVLDLGELSTQSDANGSYQFLRVPAGAYRATHLLPEGWRTAIGKTNSLPITVATGSNSTADFYTLLPRTGSVSGVVFNDVDLNGLQGPSEIGLEGFQVFVDQNANGLLDPSEPLSTSDASGAYSIANLAYGNHTVREIIPAGFNATSPVSGIKGLFLLNGESHTGFSFGNRELNEFVVSGAAFHDANANGLLDLGEQGISGLTVFLDLNNNAALDAGEPVTQTLSDRYFTPDVNETGTYSFPKLARGSYVVREIVTAELSATLEASLIQTVSVGPNNAADTNFANRYRDNEIHGLVFDDSNENHQLDSWEYARPGVNVYVDLDRDDLHDADEPSTVTGSDGAYHFYGMKPGAYIVREKDGALGPSTYPQTGGGVLWPSGSNHSPVGNVSPGLISASLSLGQSLTQSVSLNLSFSNMVDVFLLFDDTGSFTSNSPIVRDAFPSIISSLQTSLPGMDLGFGVGRLEEYGNFALEYANGRPFILNQPVVSSSVPGFSASIQAALDRMAPGYGGDAPETDIEALFQLVTGLGFDGNNNGTVTDSGAAGLTSTQVAPGTSGDVPAFSSFQADIANNVLPASGTIGGGGFRAGALPVVLLATDTGFAYQPKGETAIVGTSGVTLPLSSLTQTGRGSTPYLSGAGIQETVTGLNALGALVIGLGTNDVNSQDPRLGLESLAQLTGAVNRSTSTIANGTADPIAPGDPLYFQIGTGFGTTVADGVLNAIQNAVTSVAMDITVRASDPRVKIINHTGTLLGMSSGQTATFDIEFIGDGKPHRFDLQFVRAGTNVVVGSIPVELGTPVAGSGYSYDEMEDGEIHRSSHFGNYVPNQPPSFTAGSSVTASEDAGAVVVPQWANDISAGAPTESSQTLTFVTSNSTPQLFSIQPSIAADGSLTFVPAPNQFGQAIVTVYLQDNGGKGSLGSDVSGVVAFTISVEPVNDAPVSMGEAYSMQQEATLTVDAPGLLANDVDVDGDSLTSQIATLPTNGSVALLANGAFQYTPRIGFVGADTFTYVVYDANVGSEPATVTIDVKPINHAPLAAHDRWTASEDLPLVISSTGVLSNDSDPDGDAIAAGLVSAPLHGTVALFVDGSFVYTPTENYFGEDLFTYRLTDGLLDSNVATVTLTVASVNDLPTSFDDSYTTAEDVALLGASVLVNDFDLDNDPIQAVLEAGPSHGTLVLRGNGTFDYVPAPFYNGTDEFSYRSTDGSGNSNLAIVRITVTPVNYPPMATGETYSMLEDQKLSVSSPGILANDLDPDSDILTASLRVAPLHGSIVLNANGAFTYTPAADYYGDDSFVYVASDGGLISNLATVTLRVAPVNDAPIAVTDSYSTPNNTPLVISANGVLQNDRDVEGDTITASVITSPSNGTLTLQADGSLRYVPATGFSGSDSFTYITNDGVDSSVPALVTISVSPPGTKFFVVDADRAATYQYDVAGTSLSNAVLNKSDKKPRGIASNAQGTIQWVIDLTGVVFVYDNRGVLLGQWTAQGVGKPEGITVWGSDLWIVDPTTDRVLQFTGGATRRSGSAAATRSFALNSGNLNATDLVTDGVRIWVLNDTLASDQVFRYTVSGTLEGRWTTSSSSPTPTGITLDPNNVDHLWVVDAATDRIYQYNNGTSRLSGVQEPSTSFVLNATNTNPQGIADPLPNRTESVEKGESRSRSMEIEIVATPVPSLSGSKVSHEMTLAVMNDAKACRAVDGTTIAKAEITDAIFGGVEPGVIPPAMAATQMSLRKKDSGLSIDDVWIGWQDAFEEALNQVILG